jgi:hypothetical protein
MFSFPSLVAQYSGVFQSAHFQIKYYVAAYELLFSRFVLTHGSEKYLCWFSFNVCAQIIWLVSRAEHCCASQVYEGVSFNILSTYKPLA